jgi:hypothetical protein
MVLSCMLFQATLSRNIDIRMAWGLCLAIVHESGVTIALNLSLRATNPFKAAYTWRQYVF